MQSEKPAAGTMVARNSSVQLNLISATVIRKMPDFRGSSVRIAASFFLSAGIPFQVVGSGKVVSQFPVQASRLRKALQPSSIVITEAYLHLSAFLRKTCRGCSNET